MFAPTNNQNILKSSLSTIAVLTFTGEFPLCDVCSASSYAFNINCPPTDSITINNESGLSSPAGLHISGGVVTELTPSPSVAVTSPSPELSWNVDVLGSFCGWNPVLFNPIHEPSPFDIWCNSNSILKLSPLTTPTPPSEPINFLLYLDLNIDVGLGPPDSIVILIISSDGILSPSINIC